MCYPAPYLTWDLFSPVIIRSDEPTSLSNSILDLIGHYRTAQSGGIDYITAFTDRETAWPNIQPHSHRRHFATPSSSSKPKQFVRTGRRVYHQKYRSGSAVSVYQLLLYSISTSITPAACSTPSKGVVSSLSLFSRHLRHHTTARGIGVL